MAIHSFSHDFTTHTGIFFVITRTLYLLAIILFIKKITSLSYMNHLKDRQIISLKSQLIQSTKLINKYKHNLDVMRTASHKINERFAALEFIAANNDSFLHVIKSAKDDYNTEIAHNFRVEFLPSTTIMQVDILLNYLFNEAKEKNIELNVNIKCNINDIIKQFITLSQLETLIGDHVRNSILACCSIAKKRHRIFIQVNHLNGCYQISFFDTGIPFEVDTLLVLGSRYATTRQTIGGSGIGFMTTFETVKSCKASLIIKERSHEAALSFTKQITIRFDGKNDYILASYRAEQIRPTNYNGQFTIIDS